MPHVALLLALSLARPAALPCVMQPVAIACSSVLCAESTEPAALGSRAAQALVARPKKPQPPTEGVQYNSQYNSQHNSHTAKTVPSPNFVRLGGWGADFSVVKECDTRTCSAAPVGVTSSPHFPVSWAFSCRP
jgi:hypothetical protein